MRKNFDESSSNKKKITKSQVKQMIVSSEKKMPIKLIDLGWTLSATTTGSINVVTSPTQGVGITQRTGDEIEIDRYELRMYCVFGDPTNIVRFILFQWIPLASGAPVVASILANGPTGAPDVMSHYNPLSVNKLFKLLWDEVVVVTSVGSNGEVCFKKTFKPKIKKIPFIAATTTAFTGQAYFLLVSDSGVVIHPACAGVIRTYYRDI